MTRLVISPQDRSEKLTFAADDILERKVFGERLFGIVESASNGAVIALDAPWGEGKTTFVKKWQSMLEEKPYVCIYLDAFELDHVSDPFLPLVASILELTQKQATGNPELNSILASVKKNAGRLGIKFLGLAGSIAVQAATLGAINETNIRALEDIGKDIADGGASLTEDFITSKLEQLIAEKETLEKFRKDLESLVKQITAKSKAPLVFIIDELE